MSAPLTTNVDQRLLRTTKFPPTFNVKVDMKKVNIHLIKSWAQTEIARILNNDDDVVSELVCNILEESRYPNIKELQISLTGFLDKDAAHFCENLWKLCLSAQENPQGIPKELIEAKKAELTQEKAEKEKAREEAIKRQEAERDRDREMDRIRERERDERERGRRGGSGRDFDRRPPRDSRSPPRRRRDDDDFRRARPRADTYIPSNGARRRRSPSHERRPSRSRSPPSRRRRRDSSSSRSPPRKRRNTSSERSSSPKRSKDRRTSNRNGDGRRHRSRSPARRRYSQSPRRTRRRSSTRSRSPPPKRNRRSSPSPRRMSTSGSPSSAASSSRPKKTSNLAADDLMSPRRRQKNTDNLRLSREPSITESDDRSKTFEGDEESFSFKGAAARLSRGSMQDSAAAKAVRLREANSLRMGVLKAQLLEKFAAVRAANLKARAEGRSPE